MRDGDAHINVSIPVQDVGPARQSGTSRGGQ